MSDGQTKQCVQCSVEKNESSFPQGRKICKECTNANRREKNKQKKEDKITIYECARCEFKGTIENFRFPSCCKTCSKEREKVNNEKLLEKAKELGEKKCSKCNIVKSWDQFRQDKYTNVCNECNTAELYEWRNKNKAHFNKYMSEYRKKDEVREKIRIWRRNKYINNPTEKIYQNLRCKYRNCMYDEPLFNSKKHVFGCCYEFFHRWIEYNFKDEMDYWNYGTYWHYDHLRPVSSFNIETLNDNQECFGWKNTIPLTSLENLQKADKVLPEMISYYENRAKEFLKLYPNPMDESAFKKPINLPDDFEDKVNLENLTEQLDAENEQPELSNECLNNE
jgi:hypothetical protein